MQYRIFFIGFLLLSGCVRAKSVAIDLKNVHDWVSVSSGELEFTVNPNAIASLRIYLIDQAQTSLDFTTFDHQNDPEVGIPVMEALARAAQRGVKIRYIISQFGNYFGDFRGGVRNRVKNLAARFPKNFHFIFFTGSSSWKGQDSIHEKLLIIDKKWFFTTGAGHSVQFLRFLDAGYFFKGAMVAQSDSAFERLWKSMVREAKKDHNYGMTKQVDILNSKHLASPVPQVEPQMHPDFLNSFPGDSTEESAQEEHDRIVNWLLQPSQETGTRYNARILHHNFVDQMRSFGQSEGKDPAEYEFEDRMTLLEDPVINETVNLLKSAKSMVLYSYATIMPPKLKKALLERLTNTPEFKLTVVTNSKISHEKSFVLPLGWVAGISDLNEILQHSNAHAYVLRPFTEDAGYKYLHRKLVLVEPVAGPTHPIVIMGSHNYTNGGSLTMDEMSFEVEGRGFYERLKRVHEGTLSKYCVELDRQEILKEYSTTGFAQGFYSSLSWVY